MPLSFDVLIRRAACHIAALRVQVALARLGLALRGYDPDQPRIPAGQSGGGRWTDGNSSEADDRDNNIQFVSLQDEAQDRYSVNLEEEERKQGGHTLSKHVGKSDEEMLQRVRRERYGFIFSTVARYRAGSFDSRESANDFVNRTLEQNAPEVDQVASGESERAFVTARFGYRTGREAYRPNDDTEPYMRETYGVGVEIRHDRSSSRGYRVHTAYSRND